MLRTRPENYRVVSGPFKSCHGDFHGLFFIPVVGRNSILKVLSSTDEGEWIHVSVSLPNRCPTWNEMAKVKYMFFNDDETVVQFHPKKSEYVNNMPYCLHLWVKKDTEFELPPSILVGVKNDQ
jgi:hypothetical protein